MHDWIKQLWSHCPLPNKPTHGLLTAQIAGMTHVHPALACLDSLSHVQSATNSKLWYVMIRHHSALFLPYSTWKKRVRIGGGCICWTCCEPQSRGLQHLLCQLLQFQILHWIDAPGGSTQKNLGYKLTCPIFTSGYLQLHIDNSTVHYILYIHMMCWCVPRRLYEYARIIIQRCRPDVWCGREWFEIEAGNVSERKTVKCIIALYV